MARGFESKDIEFQQAEAERSRPAVRSLTPDQRDAQVARDTLGLALARARAERAATPSLVRREALTRAIANLESQLERAADR